MRFQSKFIIHLSHLAHNVELLREIASQNEILFMIKSNAYGHGMVPVANYACSELRIKEFGCATLGEAIFLRESLRQLEFDIFVFSDLDFNIPEKLKYYLNYRIIPVISNLKDLETFLRLKDFRFFPLCLKFDTGMNRLGILEKDLESAIKLIKKSGRSTLYHIMSHFSCSSLSLEKNLKTVDQYKIFKKIKKELQQSGLIIERSSISNSGAIEQKFGFDESHIRPGLLLYGPSSLAPHARARSCWKGKNLSELQTKVLSVSTISMGSPVGYGAKPCPISGILVHVGLGYGDGISQNFTNAKIKHNTFTGTVVGRINMDMTAIVFPEEAKDDLRIGEPILFWNQDSKSILTLADQVSTIPYELFCQLSTRIPKVYKV